MLAGGQCFCEVRKLFRAEGGRRGKKRLRDLRCRCEGLAQTDDVVGMTLDITCYDLTKTFRICGVTTQKGKRNLVSYTYDGMPVTINVPLYGYGRLTEAAENFIRSWFRRIRVWDSQVVADKIINLS